MMTVEPPLILHVIHHLVTGGLENGLVNLINCLPETKFRHIVLCVEDYSDFRNRIKRADVEVIALRRSKYGVWRMRRQIFLLCRSLKPAIVHSRNLSGLDALLPARIAGVPFCIHSEHGWDVGDLDGRNLKAALLRRLHSPLVDQYITVSENLRQYLINRVGISPSRINRICNGVDTTRFVPASSNAANALPRALTQNDTILIGTVGRLQLVKDQATLIKAFAKVAKTVPSARLVVVGDGPLAADLQNLVIALGIRDLVWFSGAIDDVSAVLRTLDIFVLPSLSEGISNTILEAMSCGLPVVATSVGGNLELVQDGRSGQLFRPGDVETLTQILENYLTNRTVMRIHGDYARDLAVENFSLAGMIARYESVYEAYCSKLDRGHSSRTL